ncbi:MAG: stage V sporulation protein AC [Clostridia bacterium]|nr:stage V sporulation protein AC [Clostridia bacterium]
MKKEDYKDYVEKRAKKSPLLKNVTFAFMIGGLVCMLGQLFMDLYLYLQIDKQTASTLASISIIFIAILLTGLGVFDNIAKFAGAGVSVPISGFANSISSQAIDSKSEGYILGVGAKIFTIAGPVILYGILSGTIYGVIYYIAGLWG